MSTSSQSSAASIHVFLAEALKRTFFFLIAKDTSNQFEIKILQLVKQLRQLYSRHRIAENLSSFTQPRLRKKEKQEEIFDTFSN